MKPTRADALAAFLRSRPGVWVDGRVLATAAGFYGWRSRISDLRERGLKVENRQRRICDERTGVTFVISEYRLVA
jgi:hypothetical protein